MSLLINCNLLKDYAEKSHNYCTSSPRERERERAIIQLHYSQSYTNCIVTPRSTICAWRSSSLDAVTLIHVSAQKDAANWVCWELGFGKENPLKRWFTLMSSPRWGYEHLSWRQTRAAVIGCCCCRTQVLHLWQHGCASSRHKITFFQ